MVKNTKTKVKRTLKNYGIDLSNEVELPSLESFQDRQSFNEWKNKASSFTNRANTHYQFKKNEHGVTASKFLINKIERDTKRAQKMADKLREEATDKPFISGGKEQGTVGQRLLMMGKPTTAGISRPPDFHFGKIRSYRDLEKKAKNMAERAEHGYFDRRMEKMKENFMEILSLSFNSDADPLIEKLKRVPAEDFYEMYLMFDEFDFDLYDSEGNYVDGDIKQLENYVDRYLAGDIDFSLKGF